MQAGEATQHLVCLTSTILELRGAVPPTGPVQHSPPMSAWPAALKWARHSFVRPVTAAGAY